MRKKWFALAPLAIVGILAFIAIGGAVVMLLWNWLMPMLFAWRMISFWQAVGLLALCRILFGGFGRHGLGRASMRRRWAERWEQMTPEERAKLRDRFRQRCGGVAPPVS
jgi:hypothetical protein